MKTHLTLATAAALGGLAFAASNGSTPAPLVEGTVTGTVKFDGKAPETKPLAITEEKSKGCCPPGKTMDTTDPTLVISKDGGIANVVVTIDVPGSKVEPAAEAISIDQKMCRFEPHVLVLPEGGKVVFLNSDEVSHNVHTYATKNDAFNKTIAPGSKEEQVLAKGDRIQVKCDIHDWMSAVVFVTDTPYYAVTAEDGSFSIKGLKPGKYKAELWHEKLGKEKAEVEIKEDGTSAPLDLKLGEKKKGKK
jgi:plastocyanin